MMNVMNLIGIRKGILFDNSGEKIELGYRGQKMLQKMVNRFLIYNS